MIDATMYLTGVEPDGSYVANSCCCSMCKRMVINAGIKEVVIRDTESDYRVIPVSDWIENDESLEMGSSNVGDILSGLRECGGEGGMGMHHTLYVGEGLVKHQVRRGV